MSGYSCLVADNQTITRIGILALLNESGLFETIEEAAGIKEISEKLSKTKFEVLVIDFDFFDPNGLRQITELRNSGNPEQILVITNNCSYADVSEALDLGIDHYILKTCDKQEFFNTINAVLQGRKYFCSEVFDYLLQYKTSVSPKPEPNRLTVSETEIIKLIAQGLTTKEIAQKKFLSFHTINTHRKNIFRKLNVKNTSELVMSAIRSGIVETTEYYI